MARNGSGVMSIPNTLVSGATVTASAHNQNYTDVAAEITNSVAADGQTPMTAPLKFSNGSAAAPSVTFASDVDSGWYRKAANSVSLSLEGVDRVVFSTANASFNVELIASATATFVLTANFTLAPVVPAKSFAISKFSDTTANRLFGTDGSGVWSLVTLGNGVALSGASLTATAQLPRGYIDGCIISNNSGGTTALDFAAGVCRDSTNAVNITCAAMTAKVVGSAWTVGNSGGLLDTGAIGNNTYHTFAISKADGTQDYLISLSATSPTLPATYVYFRLIGSIVRVGGAVVLFNQLGDVFRFKTPTLDIDVTAAATSTSYALASVPTGFSMPVVLTYTLGGSDLIGYARCPTDTDTAPSTTVAPLAQLRSDITRAGQLTVNTDTSAQIAIRTNGAAMTVKMTPTQFTHPRGKNL